MFNRTIIKFNRKIIIFNRKIIMFNRQITIFNWKITIFNRNITIFNGKITIFDRNIIIITMEIGKSSNKMGPFSWQTVQGLQWSAAECDPCRKCLVKTRVKHGVLGEKHMA
jgi:hypothetical protein